MHQLELICPSLPEPTTEQPGTEGKIRVMEDRVANGEAIFHFADYRGSEAPGMFLTPSDLERLCDSDLPDGFDEEEFEELDE
jgi:hypothetical protein